jgi:hypothetical protein
VVQAVAVASSDDDDDPPGAVQEPPRGMKPHADWVDYEWTTVISRGEALTNLSVAEAEKFMAEEAERQHPGFTFRPEQARRRANQDQVRKYRCRSMPCPTPMD